MNPNKIIASKRKPGLGIHDAAYDEPDRTLVNERVTEFRDQVKRRLPRRADGGRVQVAAPDATASICSCTPYMLWHRHSLWHAVVEAASRARACRAQLRSRLRAFHRPARTCNSTGSSCPSCPMRWPISSPSACTASRPPATACATSRPISGRASLLTRSRIRASGRNCCASTPRCIRNSRSCRASSRSRCRPLEHDRAAVKIHDLGVRLHRNGAWRDRVSRCWSAADSVARLSLPRRWKPFRQPPRHPELHRGGAARLQPVRPPRQHLQGAHQDPRPRARRREIPPPKRRRSEHGSAMARSPPDEAVVYRHPPGASPIRTMRSFATSRPNWCARLCSIPLFATLAQVTRSPPTRCRVIAIVTLSLKPVGRHAGRRHSRADGRDRRASPTRYSVSARSASATSRIPALLHVGKRDLPCAADAALVIDRAGDAERLIWSPTSFPARGSTTARWRDARSILIAQEPTLPLRQSRDGRA